MNDSGIHEPECEDQPEGFPCICDHVKDRKQQEYDDLLASEDFEE